MVCSFRSTQFASNVAFDPCRNILVEWHQREVEVISAHALEGRYVPLVYGELSGKCHLISELIQAALRCGFGTMDAGCG